MPSVSPPRPWPRGPKNELHRAAFGGSTEGLEALLSDGSLNIDQQEEEQGYTPLMIASGMGHSRVARILLNRGANASIVEDDGFTALHMSAQNGHLAISKMLVEAGVDLETANSIEGATPLAVAAGEGHLGVMSVLMKAGANPNSRRLDGATPLYIAVQEGHVGAVKMLLRAKADPLLTWMDHESGTKSLPVGIAAQCGHSEIVRELVQQVGIDGCGGPTRGVEALRIAATHQHLGVVAVLTDAGVLDNGEALTAAALNGREASVKFLLQHKERETSGGNGAYVNSRVYHGATPLLCATGTLGFSPPSPRIVRLLVDAGADTTSVIRIAETSWNSTPLALVSRMLRAKTIDGKDATEEQLHRLEGIRRLLLRVEAVHAASFLWPVDISAIDSTSAAKGVSKTAVTSTSLRMMLPILRRTAQRPRVVLAALCRSPGKTSPGLD